MKTKLAILMALATGSSFGAYASSIDVPAPSVSLPGAAPRLYPSEQGAFKTLEVATQMVESRIVQKGCQAAVYPLEVHTIFDGSGNATLGQFPNSIILSVALGGASTNNGRWYTVSGSGALDGLNMAILKSQGSFNIGSSIQELSTSWTATSSVTNQADNFKGTIIKDYWRLTALQPIPDGFDNVGVPVSTVIDYGYQQVTKNNFAKAKYWQQSRTWRDDGVNSGTHWVKTRVAPSGLACIIEVKLQGYGESPADNIEGFNERGSLEVKNVAVGPFVSN